MESLAIELTTVVQDDHPGYPKFAYDVFPHKFLDFCFCDRGERLYFHPFREVINYDELEPHLFLTLWQRAYDIKSPLGKRPW